MKKTIKAAFICLLATFSTVPPAIATNPILEAFEDTWRVTSLYGPRYLDGEGTRLHRGIDFAPGPKGKAMGYMIKSRSAGEIVDFKFAAGEGGGWMMFIRPTDGTQTSHNVTNIVYMHLFQNDGTVTEIKSSAEGYTKVEVVDVAKKVNTQKGLQINYCKAIAFWKSEILTKVLTRSACKGGIYGKHTNLPAESAVKVGNEIAPIGNSFSKDKNTAQHLHLTINHPAQKNPFYVIKQAANSGSDNAIFYKNPNDTTQLLTNKGFWFDIATGSNLSLNSVDLLLKLANGTNIPLTNIFNFGGAPYEKRINTENGNVYKSSDSVCKDLPTGSYASPAHIGCDWNGTPNPRKWRFFYPYDIASLPSGTHQICLTAKDVSANSILSDVCTSFIPSSSCDNPKIGDKCHGGIVFYVDGTGKHGLVAATNDIFISSIGWSFRWDNKLANNYVLVGAFGDGVGAGKANTDKIIATLGSGGQAAFHARNYRGGDYTDWYLPSKTELDILYQQRSVVSELRTGSYWSSTEINATDAWSKGFDPTYNGYAQNSGKNGALRVRAVRAF